MTQLSAPKNELQESFRPLTFTQDGKTLLCVTCTDKDTISLEEKYKGYESQIFKVYYYKKYSGWTIKSLKYRTYLTVNKEDNTLVLTKHKSQRESIHLYDIEVVNKKFREEHCNVIRVYSKHNNKVFPVNGTYLFSSCYSYTPDSDSENEEEEATMDDDNFDRNKSIFLSWINEKSSKN